MKSDRRDGYLNQMLVAAIDAITYAEGLSKDEFFRDRKTQQAIILNLLMIGEVATKLIQDDKDYVTRNPSLPWQNMRGMRNRIAHGYFDINLDIVWETIQIELPKLIEALRKLD